MSTVHITGGLSVEKKLEEAYNELWRADKVDLHWNDYIQAVADIVVENDGDTNDAVDMVEDFLQKHGVQV